MTLAVVAIISLSAQFGATAAAAAGLVRVARVRSARLRIAAYWSAIIAGFMVPLGGAALTGPAQSFVADSLRLAAGAVNHSSPGHAPAVDGWLTIALVVLIAGVVARAAWITAGWVRLRRAADLPPAHWPPFEDLRASCGVDARLIIGTNVSCPFTFGLHPAFVVVPAGLLEQPARTVRAVLLHELVHVARRDWLWTLGEEAVRAILWFHPAAWWLTGEIRLAREEVVDRLVADKIGSRRDYLALLVAEGATDAPGWRPVPAFIRRRQLARRVRALTAEVSMTRRHRVLAALGIAIGLACTARVAVAAFPILAEAHALTPASAHEDGVEKPVVIDKVDPVYPPDAKEQRIEGTVSVAVRVGTDGLVKDATVRKSVPQLDEAALAAVRQWKFRPGRAKGKPVEVVVTITFEFRLS
jgi:bla regulator protein blaR1